MKNIEAMTIHELTDAARDYDQTQNEGHEGYNPYRDELAKRAAAHAAATPETLEEQRDRLDDRKYRIERGAFAGRLDAAEQAEIAEIEAQISELDAKIQAEFEAAWPRDLTAARLAEWNRDAQAGKITHANKAERERQQGWTMDDLKKAIKHHKIQ